MRRGPGGSGTEPRCPPASSRRPSTASRPGEAQRAGEERGGGAGGCPLTGPAKRFPVGAVDAILRDVLRGYLQEQPYEPGVCREMAKTIAEQVSVNAYGKVICALGRWHSGYQSSGKRPSGAQVQDRCGYTYWAAE
ncbi:dynein light chain Tctex-type 5 isoform X2 [Cygnus atratus]|uniref:dynein light chain Tctex-type 5 isoform X2 n=1 Tax=Cygnus atratus TaxID=8868 RepID=UPI0021B8002C|nr:dynein light chain Tctex-type 5 isoform X2 [Cygnus atratus]